jgi:hypothetical protein
MLFLQALFQTVKDIFEKREGSQAGSGSAPLTTWIRIREAQKHADPDPVQDTDPKHWFQEPKL